MIKCQIVKANMPYFVVLALLSALYGEHALAEPVGPPATFRVWGKLFITDEAQPRPATGARINLVPDGQSIILEENAVVDAESRWQLFSDPVRSLAEQFTFQLQARHNFYPDYVVVDTERVLEVRPRDLLDDGQVWTSFGTVYLRSRPNAAAFKRSFCDQHQNMDQRCYEQALHYAKNFDLFQRIADIQMEDKRFEDCADTHNASLVWLLEQKEGVELSSINENLEVQNRIETAGRQYITCLFNHVSAKYFLGQSERERRAAKMERAEDLWFVIFEAEKILKLTIRADGQNRHRAMIIRTWLDSLHHLTSDGPAWDMDLANAILDDDDLRENFLSLYFDLLTGCAREEIADVDSLVIMIQGIIRTLHGRGQRVCEPTSS